MFARATPLHLFSRLRNKHCPNLPCCEHSWAEQTTGPRTMWLRVSMHVSDQIDTGEARIRAGDQEEKTITRAGWHSHQILSSRGHRRICEREALTERIPRRTQTTGQHSDRVFEASCRALQPLIDRTQSPTDRVFNIVPRLASVD